MRCTACGSLLNEGDKFCSRCGQEIQPLPLDTAQKESGPESEVGVPAAKSAPSKTIWGVAIIAVGVLLFILVSIALLGLFTSAVLSEQVVPQTYTSIAFGFGILGALLAKKLRRSGIIWFIVAFIVLGGLSAFAIGFLRPLLTQ